MICTTTQSDQGSQALVELLEAFPDLEGSILESYTAYMLKEAAGRDFELDVRRMCTDHVKNLVLAVKHAVMADKTRSMACAYYDVARYQTDIRDAADFWQVDFDVLRLVLRKRPPPSSPEDRWKLAVPAEVVKKREIQ
jgi:hypothetical protein